MKVILEGDMVVVELGLGTVHSAAVVCELLSDNMMWVDVNYGGSHLLQRYRVTEIRGRLTSFEQADHHGFCRDCMGWGLTPGGAETCSTCGGSGKVAMFTVIEVTDGGSSTEALCEIDMSKVAGIACDICREALTPR